MRFIGNRKRLIKFAVIGFVVIIVAGIARVKQPEFDEQAWRERAKSYDVALLHAEHIDKNGRFFNPWLERKSFFSLAPRKIFAKRFQTPAFDTDSYQYIQNDYKYLADNNNSISFAGHASFIIKLDGATIFLDPLLSDRAGLASKNVKTPFDFGVVSQKPIVLISHNHYDHLDTQSIEELIKKEAIFIAGLNMGEYFKSLGAKEIYELDWYDSVTIGAIVYTFLPAQHWSLKVGQGVDSTLWGGFLIEGSKTIYFSGDTGYFRGFEEFGERYSIDYALIGAGAYEPRWFMHYQHLNIDEFFLAAKELNAKITMPMHLGVIQLGDEHYLYPLHDIDSRLKNDEELSKRIKIMKVGERFAIE
ncbi:MAG: MBL fold metallo-hydrolase [Helicobacteraceae bacterium]|jgi:L-ascorbate metabolism protein UlaG (beta-lactamase superfamily)|nr:MBL fold metallo-hydrolase [Helicobacteraceae bacterium]